MIAIRWQTIEHRNWERHVIPKDFILNITSTISKETEVNMEREYVFCVLSAFKTMRLHINTLSSSVIILWILNLSKRILAIKKQTKYHSFPNTSRKSMFPPHCIHGIHSSADVCSRCLHLCSLRAVFMLHVLIQTQLNVQRTGWPTVTPALRADAL